MKPFKINFLVLLLILSSSSIYSQQGIFDGRFGVTAGYTNYALDSNVLFTKSQPGYLIGIVATAEFTDNLELVMGLNYVHHRMIFIGKENLDAEPEDLKFRLDNLDLPIILNYKFLKFDDDNIKIGVNAGITLSFFQQYTPADTSKEDYILEPLALEVKYMNFDQMNESLSINTYIPMGITVEYYNVACNIRYNKGLSDPFRKAPFYNTVYETKAKQSYFNLSFTYFLGE
ncbi:hypothetical protein AR687_16905 [Flavobacteriaceae bacterium CRH]|nr:hypothetical protein AR687_16905 [Flavobacteriaceae bacterium CRH]